MERDFIGYFPQIFPFWDALSQSRQDLLAKAAYARTLRVQEPVDMQSGAVIVRRGEIYGFLSCESGSEATVFILGEGSVYLPSGSGGRHMCHIRARGYCEIIHIAADAWQALLHESAHACRYALLNAQDCMDKVLRSVYTQLFLPVEKRVALFLLQHARGDEVTAMHSEMAMHLGTAREVVSRSLKAIAGEGMIKTERGCIKLLDIEKLEDFARR